MSHSVCGVVVVGRYSEERASAFDLRPALVHDELTLFPIDHYWSAAWQARRHNSDESLKLPDRLPPTFPREGVIAAIVAEVTGADSPTFGLLQTDYFGGQGGQWAVVLQGAHAVKEVTTVNALLRRLGLLANSPLDEWDTFGLGGLRHNPEYLEMYADICEELGV